MSGQSKKLCNFVFCFDKVLISCCQDNSEVHFKIKRTTQLKKLMNAYCDRQVCACYKSLKILYHKHDILQYHCEKMSSTSNEMFTLPRPSRNMSIPIFSLNFLYSMFYETKLLYLFKESYSSNIFSKLPESCHH